MTEQIPLRDISVRRPIQQLRYVISMFVGLEGNSSWRVIQKPDLLDLVKKKFNIIKMVKLWTVLHYFLKKKKTVLIENFIWFKFSAWEYHVETVDWSAYIV